MSSNEGPGPARRRAARSAAKSRWPVAAPAPAAAPEKNMRKKSENPASPPLDVWNS
jgi:hypothetical protein